MQKLAYVVALLFALLVPSIGNAQDTPWGESFGACWKGGTGADGNRTFDDCLARATAVWPVLANGAGYWSKVWGPGSTPTGPGLPVGYTCEFGCVQAGDRSTTTPRMLFLWRAPSTAPFDPEPCPTIEICIEPPPPSSDACLLPIGQDRYELLTSPPMLNYSPEQFYCEENCRYDYEDTYVFEDGSIENRYSNSTTKCEGEYPDGPPGFTASPVQPDPNDDCGNVTGYYNGQPICTDQADRCEASGGSYGYVNGEAVCIPEDDSPPDCKAGTVLLVTGGGGFVCTSPDDGPPETDDPNDLDGDGIPNATDTDDDGDGLADSSDPDANGDGRPDSDSDNDGTPDHDDDDDDNDGVNDDRDLDNGNDGVGDCDPTSRDYFKCAGQITDVSENADDKLESELNQEAASAGDKILEAGLDALGDGSQTIEGGEGIGSLITGGLFPSYGACQNVTIPVKAFGLELTCDRTQGIRDLLGWFVAASTVVLVFAIALGSSTETK